MRLTDCITQPKAQGPSKTCNKRKEEEQVQRVRSIFQGLGLRLRKQGLGFGLWGFGPGVQGLGYGFRISGLEFLVSVFGFRIQWSGFLGFGFPGCGSRVPDFGFRLPEQFKHLAGSRVLGRMIAVLAPLEGLGIPLPDRFFCSSQPPTETVHLPHSIAHCATLNFKVDSFCGEFTMAKILACSAFRAKVSGLGFGFQMSDFRFIAQCSGLQGDHTRQETKFVVWGFGLRFGGSGLRFWGSDFEFWG